MKMRKLLIIACVDFISSVVGLVACQLWIFPLADKLAWFWKSSDRRDYLKPGEAVFFSCIYGLSVMLLIVFCGKFIKLRGPKLSKIAALAIALPSTVLGVELYAQYIERPLSPHAFIILPVIGYFLLSPLGGMVGNLVSGITHAGTLGEKGIS